MRVSQIEEWGEGLAIPPNGPAPDEIHHTLHTDWDVKPRKNGGQF
jgi:hypothetical protein